MMSTQESVLRGLKSPESVGEGTPFAGKAKKAKVGAMGAPAVSSGSSSSSSSSSSSNKIPAKAAAAGAAATTMTTHTPTARPFKRGFADITSPAGAGTSSFHSAASSSSSFHDPPVSLPPVVRRSSLGGGGEGGDGGGNSSSNSSSSSSYNSGSTPGPKGGEGGGGGGGGGSIAPVPDSTTFAALPTSTTTTISSSSNNNSKMQRANRLFPAGLHLRRASRGSSSPSPSPYPSSSLGRKAGHWPTPTPSLLDLPSPFPSTYKLPSLPTTVGHGGPTAYQQQHQQQYQQQHHHHLPPVIGSTTLDQIVVQYLRRQHEQCANPICVLPPFSLTLPHRCPEPLLTSTAGAAHNVTRRLLQREVRPPFGGWKGQKMTRSLVFSRFRPWRSYRDESGRPLTCSVFPKGPPGRLWAGSDDGSVHLVSWEGGTEGRREGCE